MKNLYCRYFQSYAKPEFCWFVVAALKAEENVVFTRTLNTTESILEFFVPELMYDQFIMVINKLVSLGYIESVIEMENRYIDDTCNDFHRPD